MLNAFNNDIEYKNRMFHIQTEDNGIKNAHITTNVFYSGQSLDVKVTSYKDTIANAKNDEEINALVRELMVNQHRVFYKKLFDGVYDEHIANIVKTATTHKVANAIPSTTAKPAVSTLGLRSTTQNTNTQPRSTALNTAAPKASVTNPQIPAISKNSGIHAKYSKYSTRDTKSAFSSGQNEEDAKFYAIAKDDYAKAYTGITWPPEDLSINSLVLDFLSRIA